MSRWRPPAERSSPYITAQGMAALKAEYDELWRRRRPEVVRALAAAAAEGDRSENAEYQYRKKELREIDRRVRYLQKRIPDLKVASQPPDDQQRIFFGAEICLWTETDGERQIRIVGADEAEPSRGWISVDSPLARQLMGKASVEEVLHQLPERAVEGEIVSVVYSLLRLGS